MNFVKKLQNAAQDNGSIVCLGMDPVIEEIPVKIDNVSKKITKFYEDILETCTNVGAVKPNYAFFAQYGFPGLRALKKIIDMSRKKKLPVILDAKRGDVGRSSEAYAREAFVFWKADAVTVSPYMGRDSVQPFINYCAKGKGVYELVRTSNPGAEDFQEAETNGRKAFMTVAEKLIEWQQRGTGAVVGATDLQELELIADFFVHKKIPILIPGVGNQGGNAGEVAAVLRKSGGDMRIHRINSSSGINYAYKKYNIDDYAGAAAKAVKEMNDEIGSLT